MLFISLSKYPYSCVGHFMVQKYKLIFDYFPFSMIKDIYLTNINNLGDLVKYPFLGTANR